MGRKPKYDSLTEKKTALALAKKLKRSSDKSKKKAQESNEQWISQYLLRVANQICQTVERRKADTIRKALKRSAVKEAVNILPKRQKAK